VASTGPEVKRSVADIRALDRLVEDFSDDLGRYPTTEEGLDILLGVEDPKRENETLSYLDKSPLDAWGREYLYAYPGKHDPSRFDVWTYGADGVEGGDDEDSDCGNWPGGLDKCKIERVSFSRMFGFAILGFLVGLPIYLKVYKSRKRSGCDLGKAWWGFHLAVLVGVTIIFALLGRII